MDQLTRDARHIFDEAVRSVQPSNLSYQEELDECKHFLRSTGGNIRVLAAGKAALTMASAAQAQLGSALESGLAVVPHGYVKSLPARVPRPRQFKVIEAGHPVPDTSGLSAAHQSLQIASQCTGKDVFLVLLSGGASALLTAPSPGLTLEDLSHVNRILLKSGATIHQINTMRKHLSSIKGGNLAKAAWPARIVTLAISDVPGDDLSVIGSGPTTGDITTFADCVQLIRQLDLQLPERVINYLDRGARGLHPETIAPDDPILKASRAQVVASNRTLLESAAHAASKLGYNVSAVDHDIQGEAHLLGRQHARKAAKLPPGACILWGGESTVFVKGNGNGGRNQEVALGAAIAMADIPRNLVLLSGGTDGIDGPTDAAGAWATPETVNKAQKLGLNAQHYLANNDAYRFFSAIDQLLMTGPTHTNVMDIGIALTEAAP